MTPHVKMLISQQIDCLCISDEGWRPEHIGSAGAHVIDLLRRYDEDENIRQAATRAFGAQILIFQSRSHFEPDDEQALLMHEAWQGYSVNRLLREHDLALLRRSMGRIEDYPLTGGDVIPIEWLDCYMECGERLLDLIEAVAERRLIDGPESGRAL